MKKVSKRSGERNFSRVRMEHADHECEEFHDANDGSESDEPLAKISHQASDTDCPTEIPVTNIVAHNTDLYCFKCHKSLQKLEDRVPCVMESCGRSFHKGCVRSNESSKPWCCSYCTDIIKYKGGKNPETWRLNKLPRKEFNDLLGLVVERIKVDMEPFHKPVDPVLYPSYYVHIVKPMSILSLEEKIQREEYSNIAEFRSDISWIQHNCYVFNSSEHPYSVAAKKLFLNAKVETQEMETCPECYRSAMVGKETWFTDVCRPPHALVWARLAGYPYWPAKVLSYNHETADKDGLRVQVHFFGERNKNRIASTDVYFLSEHPPDGPRRQIHSRLNEAFLELNCHIANLKASFGAFHYYPPGLQFSIQPMLQMWMINPPSNEAIMNAKCLSKLAISVQLMAIYSSSLKPPSNIPEIGDFANDATQNCTSNASETNSDASIPDCSESKRDRRVKLRAALASKGAEVTLRLGKYLFGNIHESFPKFNLLHQVERRLVPSVTETVAVEPARADVIEPPIVAAEVTAPEELTINPVKLEEELMKSIEGPTKKQQIQLTLSLQAAFAVFREEVSSRDMTEECLSAFLACCNSLQAKCEQSVSTALQQSTLNCVQKCAKTAHSLLPDTAVTKKSDIISISEASINDQASLLVDYERAEFFQTLVQAMVADSERQITEAKSKHWCTECKAEATLHCCRYASYCSYDCQTRNWSQHKNVCCQVQRTAQPAQSQ